MKQYAISDHNGYYVAYTDNFKEARELLEEGNTYLEEQGEEGRYAIMKLNNEGFYELYA